MIALRMYTMHLSSSMGIFSRSYVNTQLKILNAEAYRKFSIYSSSRHYYKTSVIDKQKLHPTFFEMYRCMAGHAKWQNVKHIKAEKDKQKSMLCNKYVRQVYAAVREKGPDPKQNNRLAHLLENAKKDNVPSSTLESALKKATSKKFEAGTIEMLGPGGCIVVLEYETDCISEMRRMIKVLCRKYSVGIFPGSSGKWRAAYEQKGIIKVANQLNGEPFDGEKMLDFAIEAGAEDVHKSEDDESTFYEFFCAPEDLNLVKKELEKTFTIDEAFVGYLPIATAALNDADKAIAMDFLNELSDIQDVSRLYENIG